MALTLVAVSFLRFRIDMDGFSLFLGLAFLLSSIVLFGTVGLFVFTPQGGRSDFIQKIPLAWSLSDSLFALLLVAALIMGKRARLSGHVGREIVLVLLISLSCAVVLAIVYAHLPISWLVRPAGTQNLWEGRGQGGASTGSEKQRSMRRHPRVLSRSTGRCRVRDTTPATARER